MVGRSTRSSCPGFGALTSTPLRRALLEPANLAQLGAAGEHGVGPLGGFDGQHMALGHHGGLPDIEAPERPDHAEAGVDIGPVLGGGRLVAERSLARQKLRRHVVGAVHAVTFGFQEAHDLRQDVVVAADAETDDERQIADGTEIELDIGEIRPVTPPMITRSRQPLSSRAANSLPTSPHLIQVCG